MSAVPEIGSRRRVWVRLGWLLFAVVAASIGGLVYRTLPLLYPEVTERAVADPLCDLRAGPCTARFPSGGTVRFGIAPRDIPVLKPLGLEVEIEGLTPAGVEVDFAGADMNMGYNRVRLEAAGPGRYQGEGILPICVRHQMTWEAKVMIQTARGYLVAPFRFYSLRPSKPNS
jgi:pimeloyl-ACP methyl ester carboxylesterase